MSEEERGYCGARIGKLSAEAPWSLFKTDRSRSYSRGLAPKFACSFKGLPPNKHNNNTKKLGAATAANNRKNTRIYRTTIGFSPKKLVAHFSPKF